MKNTNTNKNTKSPNKPKKGKDLFYTLGNIEPQRERILFLIIAIIFTATGLVVSNFIKPDKKVVPVALVVLKKNSVLENEINKLVQGYPIENMTKYIAQKDPKVAAFMIAIAKKESAWGKRVPVLAGLDCYNYWGFRLKTDRMGSGGHTCFDSPQQAVDIVAARIDELVNDENITTAKGMVVWKCGSNCAATGGQAAANKWISDVDFYYDKLANYL